VAYILFAKGQSLIIGNKVGLSWPYDEDTVYQVVGIRTMTDSIEYQDPEKRIHKSSTETKLLTLNPIQGPGIDDGIPEMITVDIGMVHKLGD
jgi:hypothetical protein